MTLNEIIDKLIRNGIVIEISYDKDLDTIVYDLKTGMKSHCHLYEKGGYIMAEMRYDKKVGIKDYDDVISEVLGCLHGRSFLSSAWYELFKREGHDIDKILKECIY